MLEEFRMVGRKLFEEGLITSHAGNISIRQGDKIFITATGAMLSELKEGDIVEVSLNGEDGAERASMELPAHREIYKTTEALAVVHAHPPEAIALSIQNDDRLMPQDAEGRYYMKAIPIVRAKTPIASAEVARLLPPVFRGGYNSCIVKTHGSFAIGKDLEQAYKFTSVLAYSCKILAILKSITPPPPPPPQRRDENRNRPHFSQRPAISEGIGIMGRRMNYHKR